jgi:hypothetical protein
MDEGLFAIRLTQDGRSLDYRGLGKALKRGLRDGHE